MSKKAAQLWWWFLNEWPWWCIFILNLRPFILRSLLKKISPKSTGFPDTMAYRLHLCFYLRAEKSIKRLDEKTIESFICFDVGWPVLLYQQSRLFYSLSDGRCMTV